MTEIDYSQIPEYRLIATTLFSEATKKSMEDFEKDATAIANVIHNRTKRPERFGEGYHGVILNPNQFSAVGGEEWNKTLTGNLTKEEENYFKKALQIANQVTTGTLENTVGNADHYYNDKIADPSWGKVYPKVGKTKGHVFLSEQDWNESPKKSKGTTFKKAFAEARKDGKETFDWNGKKYTTEVK